jgi:hypothetical protein
MSKALAMEPMLDTVSQVRADLGIAGSLWVYPYREFGTGEREGLECIFYTGEEEVPPISLADAEQRGILHRSDGPAVEWYGRGDTAASRVATVRAAAPS